MSERHEVYRDGKVHVLAAECATCIFRPHSRPVAGARVAEMVRATRGEHGATVICHATLYRDDVRHAICNGWYTRLGHEDHILRLALIADVIEYDPVPEHP